MNITPAQHQADQFLQRNGLREEYPFAHRFLDLNGQKLHYVDEGTGPVLLFVHGNPTWSFAWRNLIKALAPHYRCVAIDHIGCGLSDKPQVYDYRLAQHIENLQSLISQLELTDISLIAHDWGGAIGCGAAGVMPERFSRLVLMNTAAFRSRAIPLRIAACRIPVLGSIGMRGLNLFSQAAVYMAVDQSSPLPSAVRKGYLAPYNSWQNRIAVDRFVHDIPLNPRHPSYDTLRLVEDNLARLRHLPVLLPWGMRDWCFTPQFMDQFLQFFPQAQAHPFPKAGHYLFEEVPQELLHCIQGFLPVR